MKESLVDLAAGCLGGTAAILVGQPLDTVKVKMQTSPELHSSGMVSCFRLVSAVAEMPSRFMRSEFLWSHLILMNI